MRLEQSAAESQAGLLDHQAPNSDEQIFVELGEIKFSANTLAERSREYAGTYEFAVPPSSNYSASPRKGEVEVNSETTLESVKRF